MTGRKRSSHRDLAQDCYFLANPRRMRRHWLWLAAVALSLLIAVAAALAWERHVLRDRQMEALIEDNRQLRAELSSTREALEQSVMDLEISAGTRAELERQLGALSEQYRQVREELEFIRSADSDEADAGDE